MPWLSLQFPSIAHTVSSPQEKPPDENRCTQGPRRYDIICAVFVSVNASAGRGSVRLVSWLFCRIEIPMKNARIHTLENENGMTMKVSSLGGTVTELGSLRTVPAKLVRPDKQ